MQKCEFYASLVSYVVIVVCIVGVVFAFSHSSSYFRFGPNSDFTLAGVAIDTTEKYTWLLVAIFLLRATKTLAESYCEIPLTFMIYDDKRQAIDVATELSKRAILCTSLLYSTASSMRGLFKILITVSQFDVALADLLFGELIQYMIVHDILSTRTFTTGPLQTPLRAQTN
ncbi:MAG: hypothetical protein CMO44_17605 [Verrucomicrobiales bacterium]|nr:hypothetical protein [Verrucomicrobiales bacterium]